MEACAEAGDLRHVGGRAVACAIVSSEAGPCSGATTIAR
jgi:hypothetical protein